MDKFVFYNKFTNTLYFRTKAIDLKLIKTRKEIALLRLHNKL
ncbi:hypothetical protein [Aliarcobacter butzleri]